SHPKWREVAWFAGNLRGNVNPTTLPTKPSITHYNKQPQQQKTHTYNERELSRKSKRTKNLRRSRPVTLPDDLGRSTKTCERGRFYESLMPDEGKAELPEYRRRIKVRFYRVLFGRNRPTNPRWPNEVWERFGERHPTLARVLKRLKRKNYRHSSHLLQN